VQLLRKFDIDGLSVKSPQVIRIGCFFGPAQPRFSNKHFSLLGLTSFRTTAHFAKAQSKASAVRATKIDEILAWEKQKAAERDTRFVELGRLPVRSEGGTVLAGGECEVLR
jgi:hypothetical protein